MMAEPCSRFDCRETEVRRVHLQVDPTWWTSRGPTLVESSSPRDKVVLCVRRRRAEIALRMGAYLCNPQVLVRHNRCVPAIQWTVSCEATFHRIHWRFPCCLAYAQPLLFPLFLRSCSCPSSPTRSAAQSSVCRRRRRESASRRQLAESMRLIAAHITGRTTLRTTTPIRSSSE